MKPKILVVGDVMLDRYIHGVVERISPEAPIPILRQTHTEDRPGGAANVAENLMSLGADVQLVGGSTAIKHRYVCGGHQMLRVDLDCARPDARMLNNIDERVVDACMGKPAAMILSDYAGGVLDRAHSLIMCARAEGVPVYVDPKGTDWTKYRGATLIKPNEIELRAVVGECDYPELLRRGADLLRELGIDQMLVTHGAGGMTWINRLGDYKHQPAKSGPVVDVTGAGDTVLACVVYMQTLKMPWYAVLNRAAAGAAAVCARHGTSVVTPADLGMAVPEAVPA